jgi:hypothetical protein
MYVDVRQIDNNTVPGPTLGFAKFNEAGELIEGDPDAEGLGDVFDAFENGRGGNKMTSVSNDIRRMFSQSFAQPANGSIPIKVRDGLYGVHYTDLVNPKVPLDKLTQLLPVTAAGYTFQAPRDWGKRLAVGELQTQINKILQQEASIASAIGAWDALSSQIGRTMRLFNARLELREDVRGFLAGKIANNAVLGATGLGLDTAARVFDLAATALEMAGEGTIAAVPRGLPTGGLAVSPGDALAPAVSAGRVAFGVAQLNLLA